MQYYPESIVQYQAKEKGIQYSLLTQLFFFAMAVDLKLLKYIFVTQLFFFSGHGKVQSTHTLQYFQQ